MQQDDRGTVDEPFGLYLKYIRLFMAELGPKNDFDVVADGQTTAGRFTFWISLSLRLSLSLKFGLRPKIRQKVKSFFSFGFSDR